MTRADDRPPDVAVIGGGIVGLATAWSLLQRGAGRIVVLEKEDRVAAHQSGHNSGVIHSGIYYRPGSRKATLCTRGREMLETFCTEHRIAFDRCGKVIVATDEGELPRLDVIADRGKANGINARRIGPDELAEFEPNAAGIAALHVAETGIVDFPAVCRRLAQLIEDASGAVRLASPVTAVRRPPGSTAPVLITPAGPVSCGFAVNCAGLFCDRVARWFGDDPPCRIIPFRGEYHVLVPPADRLVRNLIYPVPDPAFPFLGVHFTRMIAGGVEAGPNAVLALAREGYTWHDASPRDLAGVLTSPGFLRLAARNWRTGVGEMHRSLSRRAFAAALQRLVPSITADHLGSAPAGVRAQAVNPDGTLVDDFLFLDGQRALHVLNAPSPAATSSLAIGEAIADRVLAATAA